MANSADLLRTKCNVLDLLEQSAAPTVHINTATANRIYNMMAKTFPSALTLALALVINPAQAADVQAEKAMIEQYSQQLSTLQSSSDSLRQQIAGLGENIEKKAAEFGPEEKEFRLAEERYQLAKAAAEDKPTKDNLEQAEAARFEFVMAERKYQRATADVTKLRKQQQKLEKDLARNDRKIRQTNNLIAEQQQSILNKEQQARQQASQQAAQERQLRIKQQGALQTSQDELSRTKEEHAAAMAEIAALKAMLAEQEAAAAREAAQATVAVASLPEPAVANDASPVEQQAARSLADAPESPRDKYMALIAVSEVQSGKKHRVNKIIHVKTYKDNRLSKQTSHSLRHLGNGIYEGRTAVRAGSNSFVVGSRQWRREIPAEHHKEDYVFILDTRDKSRQKLVLFARAEVE